MRWERVPPPEPCASPDGHTYVDIFGVCGSIPVRVFCLRCSRDWRVVLIEEDV